MPAVDVPETVTPSVTVSGANALERSC